MTFRPTSGPNAIEPIHEDHLEGYSFGDPTLQYVQGGALRLLQDPDSGVPVDPVGPNWPVVAWEEDNFPRGEVLTARWGYYTSEESGEPSWDADTDFLDVDVDTGQWEYFRQAADETGSYWSDNVDASNGYLIETQVQVLDGNTSEPFLVLDDGTNRVNVQFADEFLRVGGQLEHTIPTEWQEKPQSLRLIIQDSDLYVWVDGGMGLAVPDALTGASSVVKELVLGYGETGVGHILVDYLNQAHGEAITDIGSPTIPYYSTALIPTTLPAFSPKVPVASWGDAIFDLAGDTGTTQVQVQHRSSGLAGWTNEGLVQTLSTTPRQAVDLTGTPEGDGTDEVRFVISQKSDDGVTAPYAVSQVRVSFTEATPKLSIYPAWGSDQGDSVAIDVLPDYRSTVQFPVQANWDAESGTELLYHFDETTGSVIDSSGNGNHGIIPGGSAASTLQGRAGWFGYGIHVVGGNGQIDVPISSGFAADGNVTISLFAKAYADPTETGVIWDHKSGSRGYEVRINPSGQFEVYLDNGSGTTVTHTHTGSLIGANSWVMAWAKILSSGVIRTRVTGSDWEETTGVGLDYYSGLTGQAPDMLVNCWGTFDEFQWYGGNRDEDTWSTLSNRQAKRQNFPDWQVVVDGESVTGDRINYYYPTRMYVRMPPHTPGDVSVYVDETGDEYWVQGAYRYLPSYEIDIDAELARTQACTTKSPFRIGYEVPDGDVNLALVSSPELTLQSHMSIMGLEHEEAANLATYQQGQFALTTPDTGNANYYSYPPSVDTSDLLISTNSVVRKEFRQGRPMFYKYLVGRGRRYVYNVEASTVADAQIVRRAIKVVDGNGVEVKLEDWPWDVHISRNDFRGSLLPSNTFSAVLYTEKEGTPERTYYVVYDASDGRSSWDLSYGYREVINPVPIFERETALDGAFQYDVTLDDTGSYDLRVTRA